EPRAAAQRSVPVAEKGLRVFGVGKRAEARIAVERGRGPLPDGSLRVLELVADGLDRLLPLGLRRQALPSPPSVRVGLVKGDVLDGLTRRQRLDVPEATTHTTAALQLPHQRCSNSLSLEPRPTLLA